MSHGAAKGAGEERKASRQADQQDQTSGLQRIPGEKSLAALQAGLAVAPQDFKINIAQSLRARGVTVPGLPCQKLVPTKKTNVKPEGR